MAFKKDDQVRHKASGVTGVVVKVDKTTTYIKMEGLRKVQPVFNHRVAAHYEKI